MPIYAYKCASCGYAKDALQKISDPPLTVCPQCGQASLVKQVTAAGFQLKGSGWYVTDFRSGNSSAAPADQESKAQAKPEAQGADEPKPQAQGSQAKPEAAKPASTSESKSGGATPAAAVPAAGKAACGNASSGGASP